MCNHLGLLGRANPILLVILNGILYLNYVFSCKIVLRFYFCFMYNYWKYGVYIRQAVAIENKHAGISFFPSNLFECREPFCTDAINAFCIVS